MNMTTQTQGQLFIIAAPSGAGKTSLVQALVTRLDGIKISISHTTRPKRPAEENGVNYFFISSDQFEQMIQQGAFLEFAQVFNYQYGTSKDWVLEQLKQGVDIILEIDWQGAARVRQQFPHAKSIFILPPSLTELTKRLTHRQQDDNATIEYRMEQAQTEMTHYVEFDYLVLNAHFEQAVKELTAIVWAARLQRERQQVVLQDLLGDLL